MARLALDSFAVDLPEGWADITDAIDSLTPPRTFGKGDGVGALQFSVALYRDGPLPLVTPMVLREMVEEFGRVRGFEGPSAAVTEPGPPLLAAGSFLWGDDFVRVWQVSDGCNFAFISYTSSHHESWREVADCEQIVRSIEFWRDPKFED